MQQKSEWITREAAQTDEKSGTSPRARPLEQYIKFGLVVLDKPYGPTSHQVSAWLRDIFKAIDVKKAGHIGTLDPHVTGVLPVLIQDAVKIAPLLQGAKKEYICLMRLHSDVPEKKIREVAQQFIGKIKQVPPKKAAVKRRERVREIYYFEILEIDGRDVLFKTGTEAGFYVRKFCIDFGKALGTAAHMAQLRRTIAGPFAEKQAVTLNDVRDAFVSWTEASGEEKEKAESWVRHLIKPLESALDGVKKIIVKDSAVAAIAYGAPLHVGGISKIQAGIEENDFVAVLSLKGELVAVGRAALDSETMAAKRAGLAVRIERVVIPRDVYPKEWGEKKE